MFLVYNLLLTLFSPIWVPWMLWRTSRREKKPNWKERTGDYSIVKPEPGERRIWVHAVSVGEVVAALPILREIRSRDAELKIVLSVTTSSGHTTAEERAIGLFDHLVYFPLDVPRFQLAAMVRVQPKVVAIMETELWMNFLWAAKSMDARTMLVNGRISDRSFPRSRRLRFFYRSLLRNLDEAHMQTQVDAERIMELGAKTADVFGNCKFDEAASQSIAEPQALRIELGLEPGKPVLVIGSTRGADEEQLVIRAIAGIGLDKLNVVHAPRHLERVPELAAAVERMFGTVALRSKAQTGPYLILDTYGELGEVYSLADLVIVGGAFGPYGGQNLIQPLAQGKPVIHGPHMDNFQDAANGAHSVGASIVCPDSESVESAIRSLLENADKTRAMGEAAAKFVRGHLGAADRYAQAVVAAANSAERS